MADDGIDMSRFPLADGQQSHDSGIADTGNADGVARAQEYGGSGVSGSAPEGEFPVPDLTHSLGDARRRKLAALFSGGYDPKQPRFEAMPKGMTGQALKKEEPLIGPDGGAVGRIIKSGGDWYQDFVKEGSVGLDKVMRDKLTPPDYAVDALATVGHSATTGLTGIETGFEPKYWGNKVFQLGAVIPKGISGLLPSGTGVSGSPFSPTPLLVQGARFLGGDQIKPEEAARAAASGLKTGIGVSLGVGSSRALHGQELVDKLTDAGLESAKVMDKQR